MVTPDDIAAEGFPDPYRPLLKNGGRQVVKGGGMAAADADFDRLSPRDVRMVRDGVRTGHLADGRTVIVRPFSQPTLEIQADKVPVIKIRYGPR